MYVCMCVCMYMYVRTYVCMYVCMYACMYGCLPCPLAPNYNVVGWSRLLLFPGAASVCLRASHSRGWFGCVENAWVWKRRLFSVRVPRREFICVALSRCPLFLETPSPSQTYNNVIGGKGVGRFGKAHSC